MDGFTTQSEIWAGGFAKTTVEVKSALDVQFLFFLLKKIGFAP